MDLVDRVTGSPLTNFPLQDLSSSRPPLEAPQNTIASFDLFSVAMVRQEGLGRTMCLFVMQTCRKSIAYCSMATTNNHRNHHK